MHLAVCHGVPQAKLMQQQLQVVCCFRVAAPFGLHSRHCCCPGGQGASQLSVPQAVHLHETTAFNVSVAYCGYAD